MKSRKLRLNKETLRRLLTATQLQRVVGGVPMTRGTSVCTVVPTICGGDTCPMSPTWDPDD